MRTYSFISRLAARPVLRDLLLTFAGRIAVAAIALLGSIISARVLGPLDLGRFGLIIATVTVAGTLADFGLTYTAVKLIARHAESSPGLARSYARTYFTLRVCTGAMFALLGWLICVPLARAVLGDADLSSLLALAFLTLVGLGVGSYPGTVLTGLQFFKPLAISSVLNAGITLLGIALLWIFGLLNLTSLVAWNVCLPLLSTLPGWLLLPREWLPWRISLPELRRTTTEMVGFSKWIALAAAGSILALQGDLILLGRLAGPAAVGVYAVALSLVLRLDTLNQSLLIVLLPRASKLSGRVQVRQFSRRVLLATLGLAAALGILALLSQPLILALYGAKYAMSAGLFLALLPVLLFDLVTSSLFLAAFPLERPRVLAASDWLRVAALGLAGLFLIPQYSGFGAAASRLLSRVVGASYTLYALREAAQEPEPETASSK